MSYRIEHDINGYREEYQGALCRIYLKDKKGADMSEWPEDLRVRQFPGDHQTLTLPGMEGAAT